MHGSTWINASLSIEIEFFDVILLACPTRPDAWRSRTNLVMPPLCAHWQHEVYQRNHCRGYIRHEIL